MTRVRTYIDALHDKLEAVKAAEKSGKIADSAEVRGALIARVLSGEITIEQCQAELKEIRRGARRARKVTRSQVWRRS